MCIPLCVYKGRHLWPDRVQLWHTHADSCRKANGPNKKLPRVTWEELGGGWIGTKFGTLVRMYVGMNMS